MSNMKKTVKNVSKAKTGTLPNPQVITDNQSGDKVVVCLNLGHSLVFDKGDKKIYINGTNEALRGQRQGVLGVGAFGYTLIDKQDWEMIKKEWANMPVIKNGFLFAESDMRSANAAAEERKEMRHGLEPVDVSEKEKEA